MNYSALIVSGLAVGAIYGLVALGYHMIYRATHVVDFAQGEKVAIGGLFLLTFTKDWHLPLWGAILLSGACGAALGFVYERGVVRFTYRRDQLTMIMATVGVSLILLRGHELIWGRAGLPVPPFTSSPQSVTIGSVSVPTQNLWIWGLLAIALVVLYFFFQRTLRGQAAIAAAANPLGASLSGINVARTRTLAFALASGLAALAGVVVAPITLAGGTLGASVALKGFAGAIVGGLANPVGAVAGALIVGVVESLVGGAVGTGYRDPAAYGLLLAMLLIRPSGIFSRKAAA